MNILHLKYAVEVAKVGSITKAAESLFMAQPNLSRSIKELESDLGIVIFDRTSRGMCLTPEGRDFISYAQKVLDEIYEIEQMYKNNTSPKQRFSISVPRASYISRAFSLFSKKISTSAAEIIYMETNPSATISNVLSGSYKLGIVGYASVYERHFKDMFESKGLSHEVVAEYRRVIAVGKDSPAAQKESVRLSDLGRLMEISHNDLYVPSVPTETLIKEETSEGVTRHIYLYDRESMFELLSENSEAFAWVSPLPDNILTRFGLVQKSCEDSNRLYRDVIIHRKDYSFTELDKQFMEELYEAKRKYL